MVPAEATIAGAFGMKLPGALPITATQGPSANAGTAAPGAPNVAVGRRSRQAWPDDVLVDEVDRLIKTRGYQDRSEAMRDLVRAGLLATKSVANNSECVASLTYAFDRNTRDLRERLAKAFQDHHDLVVATMRVILDHVCCMEISILRGQTKQVEEFAGNVMAERGIRHGRSAVILAAIETGRHAHGTGEAHPHEHVRVW
jgi:CopG family transcriptional regulator, nickel-responsive regulator